MKKLKLIPLLAAMAALCALSCNKPDSPATDPEYVKIPDAKFKAFLLEKFDVDKDGNISSDEAKKVTSINCSSLGITDLTGIRCFTELVSLNCSKNAITNLTLAGTKTKADLAEGDCSKLKELNCSSNKITAIIVNNCPVLETVNAGSNELKTVDVSNNPALSNLDVSGNNITEINVSSNPALTELNISGNEIKEINITNNPALTGLNVSGNKITEINVTGNPVLTELNVSGNDIQAIDVSENPALSKLDCSGNDNLTEVVATQEQQSAMEIKKDESKTIEVVTSIDVTGVTLDVNSAELIEGTSIELTATIAPKNATNKAVDWKSSDDSIATVDKGGKVSGLKPGTVTITVTTQKGGKTAECSVKVLEKGKTIAVIGVTMNKTSLELTEGEEAAMKATVAPANASNKNVSWTSSDAAIASVDSTGKVSALKPGTATITVTTEDGQKSASCTVTVNKFIDSREGSLTDPVDNGTWEW